MALLIAAAEGPLEEVTHFERALSGAEVNVSIGLSRLGHDVEYLTRLGDDPFGHYIEKTLRENQIGTEMITYDPIYRTGIQLKNRVTDGSDPYAPYTEKVRRHLIFPRKRLILLTCLMWNSCTLLEFLRHCLRQQGRRLSD